MQERTVKLIGEERFNRLKNSKVLVVGVGGVGGYVVEMLARAGVGNITVIDGDKVDVTNINRQIIALNSTIGMNKVDVIKSRVIDINKSCNIIAICDRINSGNVSEILGENYDYVIDCIDSVPDKVALIKEAITEGKKIISCMGAGNRYNNIDFTITDIYKTRYDKLARKMRQLLKKEGVKKLDVCYSESNTEKVEGVIGSISYGPPLAGVKIAQYVLLQLMEQE